MTDKDITKLASKLAESLATKEDIKEVQSDIEEVRNDVGRLENKMSSSIKGLEGKLDELDSKADTILEFAEEVDETTTDHEKRLKRIEAVPVIAHQIKK